MPATKLNYGSAFPVIRRLLLGGVVVVLVARLRVALGELNPALAFEALETKGGRSFDIISRCAGLPAETSAEAGLSDVVFMRQEIWSA